MGCRQRVMLFPREDIDPLVFLLIKSMETLGTRDLEDTHVLEEQFN